MQYTLSCALYCDARCVSDTSTYGLNDTKFGGRCVGNSSSPPDLSRGMHGFTCFNMGISPGCSDQYLNFYDCQWIDITGLPDGYYWLTVSSIVSIVCSIVSTILLVLDHGRRPHVRLTILLTLTGGHQLGRGRAREDLTRERLQQQRSQRANPDRRGRRDSPLRRRGP